MSVVNTSQRPLKNACWIWAMSLMTTGLNCIFWRAEVVREVQLGGGAGLHADGGAVQFLGALDAERLPDHEALAVVEPCADEDAAQRRVTARRPGRVAGQDVDFARLQQREAVLGIAGDELRLVGIAQDGSGQRFAVIDVDAGPTPLLSGAEKPARPVLTAQRNAPLDLMLSRFGPACTGRGAASAKPRTVASVSASADARRRHAP